MEAAGVSLSPCTHCAVTATGAGEQRETIKNALLRFLERKGWQKHNHVEPVFKACLAFLSTSRAWLALINLEDLWLGKKPQNIPSTGKEYPNWWRKTRYSLETLCQMPKLTAIVRDINNRRRWVFRGRRRRYHDAGE